MIRRDEPTAPAEMTLASDQIAYIVLEARAFDALVAPAIPDDGSNEQDDGAVGVLDDDADNATGQALRAAINSLNVDAKAELVALAWLGRGDYEDWDEACAMARERAGEGGAARYLMGLPMLGDLLEEGAEKIGISLAADETEGLHQPAVERVAAGEEPR